MQTGRPIAFRIEERRYITNDEKFILETIECINRHLNDPDFNQAQLIKEMHTTRSTLYRRLKTFMGLNFSDFIKDVRLMTAADIIAEKKNIRVAELAFMVGFNNPQYFTHCFKKKFNITPTEYINRLSFL